MLGTDKSDPAPEKMPVTGPAPEIGTRKSFTAAAWLTEPSWTQNHAQRETPQGARVSGTVVSVNRRHRWYRVRYDGCGMHECFKF